MESDGILAVKAARGVIEAEVSGDAFEPELPSSFDKESGVFVTINTYPEGDLRGCIGYPDAVFPLNDALVYSAQSACHDPRFPPLSKREASQCTVEVTILTKPEIMDKKSLPGSIVIGKHGLVIQFGRRRGVLLPQVPVEWGWDAEEFLCQLSLKAGLPMDAWKLADAEIYAFEGEIYHETEPYGDIVRG